MALPVSNARFDLDEDCTAVRSCTPLRDAREEPSGTALAKCLIYNGDSRHLLGLSRGHTAHTKDSLQTLVTAIFVV